MESAIARALRIFAARAFLVWWDSLSDQTKAIFAIIAGLAMFACTAYLIARKMDEWFPAQSSNFLETEDIAVNDDENKTCNTGHTPPIPLTFSTRFYSTARAEWQIILGLVISVMLLFLAVVEVWPYNFYVLTRIIVCFYSVRLFICFRAQESHIGASIAALVALIFNPITPFRLDRDNWLIINCATILALLIIVTGYLGILMKAVRPVFDLAMTAPQEVSPRDQSASSYRCCSRCRVRVGKTDSFCKRCGDKLL